MGIIINRKSHDCICNRDRVGGDEGNRTPAQVIKMPLNTDFFYICVVFCVGLSIQTYECVKIMSYLLSPHH